MNESLGSAVCLTLPAYFAALGFSSADEARLPDADVQRLVERARNGETDARRLLYEQYVNRVFRTVRALVRSDADAEDITQDAMLTVLTSLHRYASRPDATFGSWVMTIAINTARRRFRRRRPELTADGTLPDAPADVGDPDDALDRARLRRVLLMALAELSERERTVISLRYGAELNATEIAAATGMTSAAVRKLLERTRTRLGDRLTDLFDATESQG